MQSKGCEEISKYILDDLTLRFIISSDEFIRLHPEEYFFVLEEAYWFALDFYKIKLIPLLSFTHQILSHNNITLDSVSDHGKFKKYKQSVKVFGTMMFSRDLNHVLLVQQTGGSNSITFPKGKKSKNETGIECAVRETKEEVGYDVRDKIVDMSVTVFDKITFYCVFNVDMDYPFRTSTRNEISRIFWFDLRTIKLVKDKSLFKIFYVAYSAMEEKIREVKRSMFHFDIRRIERAMDRRD